MSVDVFIGDIEVFLKLSHLLRMHLNNGFCEVIGHESFFLLWFVLNILKY